MSADGTAGEIRSFSGAARRSTPSERAALLAAACLLLAAVFALGFLVRDPDEAVAVLYTLPIALVAVEVGAVGGIVAALLAVALFGVWAAVDDIQIGVLGFVTRGTGFLPLGGLLDHFSTKLRLAYDTVRRREQQLQAILDNSSSVVALKDNDGRYILVNRKFEDLFNLEAEGVKGKT